MIQRAIQRGLDGIAITDHDKLVPQDRLRFLNDKFKPFRVFTGIEVRVTEPAGMDFLVIGLHDERLENMTDYPALLSFVRRNGGYIIWAHPYRWGTSPADIRKPPDAVEIRSSNIPPEDSGKIEALAKRWGCAAVSASDGHSTETVGRYALRFAAPVSTDEELVEQLRKGAFETWSAPDSDG